MDDTNMTTKYTKYEIRRAKKILRDSIMAYERANYGDYDRASINRFVRSFDDERAFMYARRDDVSRIDNDAIVEIAREYFESI